MSLRCNFANICLSITYTEISLFGQSNRFLLGWQLGLLCTKDIYMQSQCAIYVVCTLHGHHNMGRPLAIAIGKQGRSEDCAKNDTIWKIKWKSENSIGHCHWEIGGQQHNANKSQQSAVANVHFGWNIMVTGQCKQGSTKLQWQI